VLAFLSYVVLHRNVKRNRLVKKPLVRKRMLSELNWKRKS
jgi:hypothetical protein